MLQAVSLHSESPWRPWNTHGHSYSKDASDLRDEHDSGVASMESTAPPPLSVTRRDPSFTSFDYAHASTPKGSPMDLGDEPSVPPARRSYSDVSYQGEPAAYHDEYERRVQYDSRYLGEVGSSGRISVDRLSVAPKYTDKHYYSKHDSYNGYPASRSEASYHSTKAGRRPSYSDTPHPYSPGAATASERQYRGRGGARGYYEDDYTARPSTLSRDSHYFRSADHLPRRSPPYWRHTGDAHSEVPPTALYESAPTLPAFSSSYRYSRESVRDRPYLSPYDRPQPSRRHSMDHNTSLAERTDAPTHPSSIFSRSAHSFGTMPLGSRPRDYPAGDWERPRDESLHRYGEFASGRNSNASVEPMESPRRQRLNGLRKHGSSYMQEGEQGGDLHSPPSNGEALRGMGSDTASGPGRVSSPVDDGSVGSEEPRVSVPNSRRKKPPIVRTDRPCSHCGTTESCTWRPGPEGSGTLCNTCGYYYRRHGKLNMRRKLRTQTTVDPNESSATEEK